MLPQWGLYLGWCSFYRDHDVAADGADGAVSDDGARAQPTARTARTTAHPRPVAEPPTDRRIEPLRLPPPVPDDPHIHDGHV